MRGGREIARFMLFPESIDELGRPGVFVDDVVGAQARARVAATAARFSGEWQSLLGLEQLRVAGIPLAEFVRLQVRFRLHFIFAMLEFARAAMGERPDAVVLTGLFPEQSRVLRHAFESLGVAVEERAGPGRGRLDGLAFRAEARLRRVREVTLPRYARYLGRVVRAERTAAQREDPRLLVMDSYCLTPEALGYLKSRGTLLRILDRDRGIRKILLQSGVPFRTVALRGTAPADWPAAGPAFDPPGAARFVYDGIPFFPLVEPDLRRAIRDTGPRLFAYASLPDEGLRRIVLREQNFPDGKMVVWLAGRAGIRTVMLQHGLMVGEYGYLPMDADVFVAWGEEGRRWMTDRSVPREKVEIIGFPRFDAYARSTGPDAEQPFGKRVLVVFETTEYNGEDGTIDNYRLLHLVMEAVAALPGWTVVIRFHPGQTAAEREVCRRLVRACGPGVRVSRELALRPSLSSADVVVTEASTVGLEALLAGKLLLAVRSRGYAGNPYLDSDALPSAESPEDIRGWLKRWERSPEERRAARATAKRFIDGYVQRDGELASVRLWKYCLS